MSENYHNVQDPSLIDSYGYTDEIWAFHSAKMHTPASSAYNTGLPGFSSMQTVSNCFQHFENFTFSEQISAPPERQMKQRPHPCTQTSLCSEAFLHREQVWGLHLFIHAWGLTASAQTFWIKWIISPLKSNTHTLPPSTCPWSRSSLYTNMDRRVHKSPPLCSLLKSQFQLV